MSLAQYASPYNNDDSGETNTINSNIRMTQSQNQNQNRGKGGGGSGIEKKMPSSSFRKTIKRPLAQQQQKQEQTQSQSRVANLMSKLGAVKSTSYVQGGGDDGSNSSETDLADYQPMNSNDDGGSHDNPKQYQNNQNNQNSGDINYNNDNNDDSVVTRENFENLPSTYASQYYQQYVPLSYGGQQQQNQGDSGLSGSKDDLMQKMNHIIQMLEDQQDEKTGSVTEELILYCFLGVFVIYVVDSFVRAGKYVR